MNAPGPISLAFLALLLFACGGTEVGGTRPRCGDGVINTDEECDEPTSPFCRADCTRVRCGDGILDPGEGCDGEPDCRSNCTRVGCGDGILDPGEECDGEPTCRPDCTRIRCGDGRRDAGEECDAPADPTCRADCTRVRCGDGILDPGEQCDGEPDCRPDCTFDRCGDGVIDANEECDDPADSACRPDCTRVRCGDGILDPVEECDAPQDPGCRRDCTAARCGDGRTDYGEECDDGNDEPGDGCAPDCVHEPWWWELCELGKTCPTVGGVRHHCVDPDDDGRGMGWCVPMVSIGDQCDPARAASVCEPGATCRQVFGDVSPTPWSCYSRCTDGILEPDEACDHRANGLCDPGCVPPAATCEAPAELDRAWDSWVESAVWRSERPVSGSAPAPSCTPSAAGAGAIARFRAPLSAEWLFTFEPLDFAGALALVPADGCGDPARELGCVAGFPGEPVTLVRQLASGETVLLALGGLTGAPFRLSARLRVGVCGDGVVSPFSEQCDDGNTTSGDGCSELCLDELVERDACGAPEVTAYWGGKLLPADGDDTAPSCAPDAGPADAAFRFVAPAAGRYEFSASVDRGPAALSLRDEACGATEHGCAPILPGFGTSGVLVRDLAAGEAVAAAIDGPAGARFSLGVEPVVCGDGRRAATEECDGEYWCMSTCLTGSRELEPNDTPETAEFPALEPLRRAYLADAADVDTWMVETPANGTGRPVVRRVTVGLGTPGACIPPGPGTDFLRLRLVDEEGKLLAEVRSRGPGACPELAFETIPEEIYYVQVVRGADAGEGPIGPYFFLR